MQKKNLITQDSVKLYNDCPRCFYISYKFGIERPKKTNKQDKESLSAKESEIKDIKKTLAKGVPLPSQKCPYCLYRHLVKETGVENEITA